MSVSDELERQLSGRSIPDERLELLFTCCHPALAQDAQVALTLRAVGGLSTDEIAAAFLVSPETMKRRLTRAKQKITGARVPFRVPPDHLLPDRLGVVLAVIYLVYNQGYDGRVDLADEAIRLGRILLALMPDERETRGLLALMLAHDARRAARVDDEDLVLLQDQDRSLWDAAKLDEARALADQAITGRGPYALQAAIAVLQTGDQVDWPQVAALYAELGDRTGSPVVQLNRAVAIAEAGTRKALSACWTPSNRTGSRTTSTSIRPGRSCCAGWAVSRRRGRRTPGHWGSPPTSESAGSFAAASRSCRGTTGRRGRCTSIPDRSSSSWCWWQRSCTRAGTPSPTPQRTGWSASR